MNTTEKKVSPIIITLAFLFALAVVVQVFRIQFENGEIAAMNQAKLVKVEKKVEEPSFALGTPTKESIAKGLEVYKKSCASCHGADGKSGIMPTNPAPRNFTKPEEYKFGLTFGDIFNTITNGSPGTTMTAFGYLPESERVALTHYVAEFLPEDARPGAGKSEKVDPSSIKLDGKKMNTILEKLAK